MRHVLAIVGRPNVGKSALFNRIARKRIAIVHDEPGVTRDRISVEIDWHGFPLTLVDTGGMGLGAGERHPDQISRATFDQARLAIEAAHLILWVLDLKAGITPLDREVGGVLRAADKPILLVANKADLPRDEDELAEFCALGFPDLVAVSAIHGRGMDAMMRGAMRLLSSGAPAGEPGGTRQNPAALEDPLDRPKLAIVGRPNVGKSSLINAFANSNRVLVSEVPGTTRDAVDVPIEIGSEGRREAFLLIDTAGIRKRRQIGSPVEFFSVNRSEAAIARSDMVLFVLDAEAGITRQDKKIADAIVEHEKACILVVNKWDLYASSLNLPVPKERHDKAERGPARCRDRSLKDFAGWVQRNLFFFDYAPVIFTSAKTGFHLQRLIEAIRYVAAELKKQIPTPLLNRTLHDAFQRHAPSSHSGARLKLFYATQLGSAPLRFLLFVNRKELLTETYSKYLTSSLRTAFGFEGCPLVLIPRTRPRTIEPIRRRARASQGSAGSRRALLPRRASRDRPRHSAKPQGPT